MPATVDRRFWQILALSFGLHALCLLGLPGRDAAPTGTTTGTPVASGPLRLRAQLRPPPVPANASVTASAQTPPAAGAGAVGRDVLTPRLLDVGQALSKTVPAGRPSRPGNSQSRPALATAMPGDQARPPLATQPAAVAAPVSDALPALAAAQATPAASAASAAPAGEALLDAYRRQLQALVSAPRDYPRLAALRGWEGEVRLRLRIARKGNLLAVQLDRSSGFEVLDQHALARLSDHGDFPPLPERWEGSELQVVIPIHYKLRKTT